MKSSWLRAALLLSALWCAGARAAAQSNADAAIDLSLAHVDDLKALGRTGIYPNGVNGCALETTACNLGTKEIAWQAVMDPDHPFIAFLLARESNGRFEQISDRSYVKHGFYALSSEYCSSCKPTDGSTLGIGCSDTYTAANNGDNYWLGPPDELDPWRGLWNPACSHFDRGEPPVSPPSDCNGTRSLTLAQAQALGAIGHRIRVLDADLAVPAALFWFQGMYVIETEGDAVRGDNLGSRAFTPVWNGAEWELNESGTLLHGSVLQRWSGASVSSATNGADDGRLYVATKVTGPVDGFYRYEVAVHNRDNARGVRALRIPVCPDARVNSQGFSDIDQDAGNEWAMTRNAGEIVWSTATSPLKWNSIFNFWFDCDAAPLANAVLLDEAAAGPGLATVVVPASVPLGLFNVFAGPGCALDTPPTLHAIGTPARATLGNGSFALRSTGNAPNQPNLLYFTRATGSFQVAGCTAYLGPSPSTSFLASTVLTDSSGVAVHPLPIPNKVAFEGLNVTFQALGYDRGNGKLLKDYELSDALRVRIGSAVSGCP